MYPKWKYHKTKDAFIIYSEEEETKLGSAWADSPTAFMTAETAPEVVEKTREEIIADLADDGPTPQTDAKTSKKKA